MNIARHRPAPWILWGLMAAATAAYGAQEVDPPGSGGAIARPIVAAAAGGAGPGEDGREGMSAEWGTDRFAAGPTLRIDQPTSGDLIAAGGRVEVDAPVGGDALLAGGQVRLRSNIATSVYFAGGQLHVGGEIARNLRAVGGQIEIERDARLSGNGSLAGGEITVRGPVKGSLQVAGSQVLIDAAIDGDVVAAGQHIELGPQARIGGALRWRSPGELKRHPDATVVGPVTRQDLQTGDDEAGHGLAAAGGLALRGGLLLWALGLGLVAAVALLALPRASARLVDEVRQRWAWDLLAGFVTLVCVPVAALILLASLVGAPLGLIAIVLYPVALMLGQVVGATALGLWALGRWKAESAARPGWRIGAAVLALVVLSLFAGVPWVGGLAVFAVSLTGLGAIVLQLLPRPSAGPAPVA